MGSSSSKKPNQDGFFHDGPTDFEYTAKYPIFEKKNGLLFRLVNETTKEWAFYNDSSRYEFHVTINFGPNSRNLSALGQSALSENPEGGWVGKTIVYPFQTVPFVSGEVDGFESVINAVLLTNEYRERRREERAAAKAAEKEAKKAAERGEDELGAGEEGEAAAAASSSHQNA